MDPERHEVYERIPWETLEKAKSDRQWWVYAVAGAVALGALAYSFMKNQPVEPAPIATPAVPATAAPNAVPSTATATSDPLSAATAQSPVVVAEADLFAAEPHELSDYAASYAEWFAVEYFGADGSTESASVLADMLPSQVPPPDVPDGVQVFVDWVGAQSVTRVGPGEFEVEVLVRSLSSMSEEGFVRQETRLATVPVEVGEDGIARVTAPPMVTSPPVMTPIAMSIEDVPDDLVTAIEQTGDVVVGGVPLGDGRWRVVAMSSGPDGITRPVSLIVP